MVSFNASTDPKFTWPAILLHPPIPPTLYGVNPRTIKGQEWWDEVRKEAYARNNYCCFACGKYQLDCSPPRLDAHECYNYNYKRKRAHFTEVVTLCRDCHMFIHWLHIRYGRDQRRVLPRGLRILYEAGLGLPYNQVRAVRRFGWEDELEFLDTAEVGSKLPMGVIIGGIWKLVFEGKLYPRRG